MVQKHLSKSISKFGTSVRKIYSTCTNLYFYYLLANLINFFKKSMFKCHCIPSFTFLGSKSVVLLNNTINTQKSHDFRTLEISEKK
jgi:hypothetical protein